MNKEKKAHLKIILESEISPQNPRGCTSPSGNALASDLKIDVIQWQAGQKDQTKYVTIREKVCGVNSRLGNMDLKTCKHRPWQGF